MSEFNKSWSDLQRCDVARTARVIVYSSCPWIEQSNPEKNLQKNPSIKDVKIVVGQLESQEMPVYYSV
jgi:hypothetical protein